MQYEQIYGVFLTSKQAEEAIAALEDHGAHKHEISVVRQSDGSGASNVIDRGSSEITTTTGADAEAGALKGGAAGIALGILAGAVALTVPGVGPILAAGPLWAAFGAVLATTAAGAVSGGVIGYLVDQGVPKDLAHTYGEAIGRGEILVSVRSDHLTSGEASELFEKYGATSIGRHPVDTFLYGEDRSFVDLTANERELEEGDDTVFPIVTPLTPGAPGVPGPIGR